MVEKTKHSFVDDNPYLVYTGEPNMSIEDGSNSGSGSGGLIVVLANSNVTTWSTSGTTILLNMPLKDIIDAVKAGSNVVIKAWSGKGAPDYINLYFSNYYYVSGDETIRFYNLEHTYQIEIYVRPGGPEVATGKSLQLS